MSLRKQPPTRRDFLRVSAASGVVMLAPEWSHAQTPSAKSCIVVNMIGGPAHLDTFDPKPNAPSEYRGPFRPIPTRTPGVYFSELFPKLAAISDRFTLVRSMHHTAPPIHEAGIQMLNTGHYFRDGTEWPSIGSVVSYLRDWTASPRITPSMPIETGIQVAHGFGGGWLPRDFWPVSDNHHARIQSSANVAMDSQFSDACRFAIERTAQSQNTFTIINQFATVFDSPSWDCHADRGSLRTDLNDIRERVAPNFDDAFSSLITSLAERGMLDSTLVVATGEFGRTPKLNANGGRDHWAGCWTALIAGGGVQGGRVIGASDDHGIEPAVRPVTPQEFVATILHALGIPAGATIPGPDGTPVAVYPALPINEVF